MYICTSLCRYYGIDICTYTKLPTKFLWEAIGDSKGPTLVHSHEHMHYNNPYHNKKEHDCLYHN